MVVDDTAANLALLGDLLRAEGYRVVQFPHGGLALEAARRHPPDLILLDILMPEVDGFEVCRQLKADALLAAVPVIFLSALDQLDSKVEAFAAGAVDYITKPFEREEILARVRTQVELQQARQQLEQQRATLERQVRERTAHLTRAQRMAGLGSWTIDLGQDVLHWFDESWRLFGADGGAPARLEDLIERVHPHDRKLLLEAWSRALQSGRAADYNLSYRVLVNGETRWLKEWIEFELDEHGQPSAATGSIQDITDSRRTQQTLRNERQRLQNALDAAGAGAWEWEAETRTLRADDAWAALIGHALDEIEPITPDAWAALTHPEDRARVIESLRGHLAGQRAAHQVEYRIRHREGHWVWLRSSGRVIEPSDPDEARRVAGIDVDITAQKAHEEERARLARQDPLTGLPNRVGLAELLATAIARAGQNGAELAIAYIDLDGLAVANAHFGRETGDTIIQGTAQRILDLAGAGAIVARIGGDEFVLVQEITDPTEGAHRVRRMIQYLARPFTIQGKPFRMTASAGLTLLETARAEDEEQLVRQAFQALYEAKLKGKNRLEVFDKDREQRRRRQYEQLETIRTALDRQQFVLFYQPKVHLQTGRILGFEALIRWEHPERGLVAPGEFISALSNDPLAIDVGNWVIEQALRQLGIWNAQGMRTTVSVNVDAQQLLDPDFAERLKSQLAAAPEVRPEQLELEILETSAMEDIDLVASLIAMLGQMGIRVSLDDYGTGYSSLTFVKRLPIETIKIDQSFVRGLLADHEHEAIIGGIVSLGAQLKRKVLAEGVETEEHGRKLIELGCRTGQGYGIARPMPAARVTEWVNTWTPPTSWRGTPSQV